MSKESKKQKDKVFNAFVFGLIVGAIVSLTLDYFDISDKFWDLIRYGETDVISCAALEEYYQKNHLSPDWTERDEIAVELLRHDCV